MRRTKPGLPSLIVAGLFLATMGGDAFGAHSCPHHDVLPSAAAPALAGLHAGHVADAGAPAGDHDTHGPCTCVGQCTATGSYVSPAAFASTVPFDPATTSAPAPVLPRTPLPRRPAFLIPFAHAPPFPFEA